MGFLDEFKEPSKRGGFLSEFKEPLPGPSMRQQEDEGRLNILSGSPEAEATLQRLRGRTASEPERARFARSGGRLEGAGFQERQRGKTRGEELAEQTIKTGSQVALGIPTGIAGSVVGGAGAEGLIYGLDRLTGQEPTETLTEALARGTKEGLITGAAGAAGGLASRGAGHALRAATPLARGAGQVAADTLASSAVMSGAEGRLPTATDLGTGLILTTALRGTGAAGKRFPVLGQTVEEAGLRAGRATRRALGPGTVENGATTVQSTVPTVSKQAPRPYSPMDPGRAPRQTTLEEARASAPEEAGVLSDRLAAYSAGKGPESPYGAKAGANVEGARARHEAARQALRELKPPRSVGEEYRAMAAAEEEIPGFGRMTKEGKYRADIRGGVDEPKPPPKASYMHGKKPEAPKGPELSPEQEVAYQKAFDMPPGEARDAALRAAVKGPEPAKPAAPKATLESMLEDVRRTRDAAMDTQGDAEWKAYMKAQRDFNKALKSGKIQPPPAAPEPPKPWMSEKEWQADIERRARELVHGTGKGEEAMKAVERRRSERAQAQTPEELAASQAKRRAAGAGRPPPPPPPTAEAAGPAPEEPRRKGLKAAKFPQQPGEEGFTEGHKGGLRGTRHMQAESGKSPVSPAGPVKERHEVPPETLRSEIRGFKGKVFRYVTMKNAEPGTEAGTLREFAHVTTVPPKDFEFKGKSRPGVKAAHNLETVWEVDEAGNYLRDDAGAYKTRAIHLDEPLELVTPDGEIQRFTFPEAPVERPRFATSEMGGRPEAPPPARTFPPQEPEPVAPFGFAEKGKVNRGKPGTEKRPEGREPLPVGGAMSGQFGRPPGGVGEKIPVAQAPKKPTEEQLRARGAQAAPKVKPKPQEGPSFQGEGPRTFAAESKEGRIDSLIRKSMRGSASAMNFLGTILDLPEAAVRRVFSGRKAKPGRGGEPAEESGVSPLVTRAALSTIGFKAGGLPAAAGVAAAGYAGRRLKGAAVKLRAASHKPGAPKAVRQFGTEAELRAVREALHKMASEEARK